MKLQFLNYFVSLKAVVFCSLVFGHLSQLLGQVDQEVSSPSCDICYKIIEYEDGSVFKGKLISTEGDQLLFELYNLEDSILLNNELIVNTIDNENSYLYPLGRYHKKYGYATSVNYYLSLNNFNKTHQFQILRYKLYPKKGLGAGVAFNASMIEDIYWSDIPKFGEIFLYGKRYINDRFCRLFLDSKIGVAVAINGREYITYSSGLIFQPGIGIQFASARNSKFSIHITKTYHSSSLDDNGIRSEGNSDVYNLGRINIGIGWIF